jgi:hypothetical protein
VTLKPRPDRTGHLTATAIVRTSSKNMRELRLPLLALVKESTPE